ncbi:hypothetical protein [Kitasatospora sp. NPDC091276]|uniref:hypothetical protein n=1 Tax=Kitasatospora sp. NPDC091276 TaxID=3155300 RepID=UPI003441F210
MLAPEAVPLGTAARLYSAAVLVTGTSLCLAALVPATAPAALALLLRAARHLGPGHDALERLDSVTVLSAPTQRSAATRPS